MYTKRISSVVAVLAVFLALPTSSHAQERNPMAILRGLPIDSLTNGIIPVYYSDGHINRAHTLQRWYAGLVAFYEAALSQDFEIRLAILNPQDWSRFTALFPYGVPHLDSSGWPYLVAVLPATNDEGALASAARQIGQNDPGTVARFVDVIGLHEFGHGLVSQYLYPRAESGNHMIRWFDEFMATYMGQGYLWHTEGEDADPIRAALFRDYDPPFSSLVEFDEHYAEFTAPTGSFAHYGWYQAQFAERGRAVFARQGLEFLRRVREALPWERYQSWTTDELLRWLEEIEPGFMAWTQGLREF